MIVVPLLAVAAALHPTDPSLSWPEPPEPLIDFLGRRGLCLNIPEEAERTDNDREEWSRLSCATLHQEETNWRTRYASDRDVLRWLDQDPQDFRYPAVIAHSYHGPPVAEARQVAISGVASQSDTPFHLVANSAQGGRHTMFTASFAGLPARTFTIDNAQLPWLDLQTITVAMGPDRPNEELLIGLRYGFQRGYCGDLDLDDRPRIEIRFTRADVSASYQDRTNCRTDYQDLADIPEAAD